VVLPTGGGKSICYQAPAAHLERLAVVVSPLIALMKDQVDALQARGLPATYINSSLTPEEQGRRLQLASNGQVKLLYIAPERFRSMQFTRTLAGIDVSLFAVDEAHCLSQWGHDFRPDYLRLGQAIAAVGRPPIAAFTATATGEVRDDIARNLNLVDPATFFAGIDRDNLFLEFSYPGGKGGQEQKLNTLLQMTRRHRGETGIVYASTRKNVDKVFEKLRMSGVVARPYHAGMDDEARAQVQDLFMSGKLQVIVATNAFGMGVDKADIRYVVHHDFPGSIEAYYQEVGRAGRDGKSARCLTLFAEGDRFVQEYFHQGSNPPRELIEEVHRVLCEHEGDTIELTVSDVTAKLRKSDNEMAVSTALKVLERFGVISRGFRGESRGWARARRPWPDVLAALARAPVQRLVAESLQTVAQGELAVGTEIDLGALAYEAGIDREHVGRVLLEMQRGGHLEYEPPFRGRSTHVLRRDPDIPVDWALLEEKARRDYEKIDQMMSFARTDACRKWYLRRYFMGEGGATWCGRCDRCSMQTAEQAQAAAEREERLSLKGVKVRRVGPRAKPVAQAAARPLEGDSLLLVQKVLSCVARMRGRFGRIRVAEVLKGSKSKELLRWGLDQLTTYGLLADLRIEDITAVIDTLIDAGLLQSRTLDDGPTAKSAVVALTERGRLVMLGKEKVSVALPAGVVPEAPAPRYHMPARSSGDETGGYSRRSWTHPLDPEGAASDADDDSRPYSPRIYDALCAWRSRLARQHQQKAFMILNNATLEALARSRPTTPEALRRVKGMGPQKCAAFGEDLLALILEQVRLDPDG
jgi:ATP-dependent DNA helicase RecQ